MRHTRKGLGITGIVALLLAVLFATAPRTAAGDREGTPGANTFEGVPAKYVFFFIGDGMGLPQVTAAGLYLEAVKTNGSMATGITNLTFGRFPVVGIATTWSANSAITDSAPAGTALASGFKTNNGFLGVDPAATKGFRSMATALRQERGFRVGIISSVGLNHATPASFYAHRKSRDDYYEIALQLAGSGFDFFGGGGIMEPNGKNGDRRDAYLAAQDAGYNVVRMKKDILALRPGDGKVIAVNPVLDNEWAMPYDIDRTNVSLSLADFTRKGIELLDNPGGFFLMVEGGKIDWACHANDAGTAIRDVLAFDAAVAEAVAFAEKHPRETLIVVTADHETGGLAIGTTLTKYDTRLALLQAQSGSFQAFDAAMEEYKLTHTRENAVIDDVLPLIADHFGLVRLGDAEMTSAKNLSVIGFEPSREALANAFTPDEWSRVNAAFAETMKNKKDRAGDEAAYAAYGGYEPLTVTLTRILDGKAGLGWTSNSHTGLPVSTYARGVGENLFYGLYDNTDLALKIMAIAGVSARQEPLP